MPSDIGQLLVALLPRLRRYALSICYQSEVADDLVQTACEKALATNFGPAEGVPFDAWMFRILRNVWIDRTRRQQTEGVSLDIEDHDQADALQGTAQLEAKLDLDRVREAIEQLPADRREVLMLVCVEELSYRDAAEVLGLPLGTVMSRLSRARLQLAQMTGWQLSTDGGAA
jgi:RNA polymerase sigma-70 factor, ECF subfamily